MVDRMLVVMPPDDERGRLWRDWRIGVVIGILLLTLSIIVGAFAFQGLREEVQDKVHVDDISHLEDRALEAEERAAINERRIEQLERELRDRGIIVPPPIEPSTTTSSSSSSSSSTSTTVDGVPAHEHEHEHDTTTSSSTSTSTTTTTTTTPCRPLPGVLCLQRRAQGGRRRVR